MTPGDLASAFAPIVATISPLLAFLSRFIFERRDPSAFRRIKRHAELWQILPEEAGADFARLLNSETSQYVDRRLRKAERKLNGSTLAALIFVGLLTAGLTWPLVSLALVFWPAWILAGAVALFGALLMIVGLGQLYRYPSTDDSSAS